MKLKWFQGTFFNILKPSKLNIIFNSSFLQPDKELEKRIKLHIRREQRRQAEAESGAEDVDEIID